MNFRKVVSTLGMTSIIAGATLFATGCTPMMTEEQKLELDRLQKMERSLNADIKSKKSELSKLQQEVKARQAELKKCQEDTEFVKSKLSSWPNSWPDWSPAPPEPVEEEAK
jgi:peptidoglycan hydrolase CwlO-like protein